MLQTLIILGAIAGTYHHLKRIIMTTQQELAQQLTETTAKIDKIGGETRSLLTKIQELTDAVNNAGNVSPEVEAALQALKAQVDIVDSLVPDAES